MTTPPLDENFFRHEYGRLVAMLSRRIGVDRLEDIEDAVQSALIAALEHWKVSGQAENPSAWLYRVAHNQLMGEFRQRTRRREILQRSAEEISLETQVDYPQDFSPHEVRDDLLRMLFVCCDETIPKESQLALALKTLCGFDVREIAIRLFTSDANIYKRLHRARSRLCETSHSDGELRSELSTEQYRVRLPAVHKVLYLVFTEGYLSSHATTAIRRELCNEAIRLGGLLAEHPIGQTPETYALLALMHLHAARLSARQDHGGGLLLLEEQDRDLWDQHGIEQGLQWLAMSADGDHFSRYHAEAGIAAEHCLAPSFAETCWERIVECYVLLEQVAESPIHRLNQAVAVAEWKSPADGLAVLTCFDPPTWLGGSYMWAAVMSDLHRRCGDLDTAKRYRDLACSSAPTAALRAALERRLADDD